MFVGWLGRKSKSKNARFFLIVELTIEHKISIKFIFTLGTLLSCRDFPRVFRTFFSLTYMILCGGREQSVRHFHRLEFNVSKAQSFRVSFENVLHC